MVTTTMLRAASFVETARLLPGQRHDDAPYLSAYKAHVSAGAGELGRACD